jgi:hypothetical protein
MLTVVYPMIDDELERDECESTWKEVVVVQV